MRVSDPYGDVTQGVPHLSCRSSSPSLTISRSRAWSAGTLMCRGTVHEANLSRWTPSVRPRNRTRLKSHQHCRRGPTLRRSMRHSRRRPMIGRLRRNARRARSCCCALLTLVVSQGIKINVHTRLREGLEHSSSKTQRSGVSNVDAASRPFFLVAKSAPFREHDTFFYQTCSSHATREKHRKSRNFDDIVFCATRRKKGPRSSLVFCDSTMFLKDAN